MARSISFVATAIDSRCKYWAMCLRKDYVVKNLNTSEATEGLKYLRNGTDVELEEGDCVIESEENNHRRNRGYSVWFRIVKNGVLQNVKNPGANIKQAIKKWANDEQWEYLKEGSGQIAACLRLREAILRGFEDYEFYVIKNEEE
jgi:hypothetical protein